MFGACILLLLRLLWHIFCALGKKSPQPNHLTALGGLCEPFGEWSVTPCPSIQESKQDGTGVHACSFLCERLASSPASASASWFSSTLRLDALAARSIAAGSQSIDSSSALSTWMSPQWHGISSSGLPGHMQWITMACLLRYLLLVYEISRSDHNYMGSRDPAASMCFGGNYGRHQRMSFML